MLNYSQDHVQTWLNEWQNGWEPPVRESGGLQANESFLSCYLGQGSVSSQFKSNFVTRPQHTRGGSRWCLNRSSHKPPELCCLDQNLEFISESRKTTAARPLADDAACSCLEFVWNNTLSLYKILSFVQVCCTPCLVISWQILESLQPLIGGGAGPGPYKTWYLARKWRIGSYLSISEDHTECSAQSPPQYSQLTRQTKTLKASLIRNEFHWFVSGATVVSRTGFFTSKISLRTQSVPTGV